MAPLMLIFIRGSAASAHSGKYNPATGAIEHPSTSSGQARPAALVAITAVKYTGQEYDPETGFYYYNARYYDPQLGIFTTPDIVYDKNAGSFGFNRHMYVAGNPIIHTDPSGHNFWKVLGVVTVIAAAVAATALTAGALAPATAAGASAAAGGTAAGTAAAGVGAGMATGAAAGAGMAAGAAGMSVGTAIGIGAVSGAAGGFVGGAGMAWVGGETDFGRIMTAGLYGALGGAAGGAIGGYFGHTAQALGRSSNIFSQMGSVAMEHGGRFAQGFTSSMVTGGLHCSEAGRSCRDLFKNSLAAGGIAFGANILRKISPYRLITETSPDKNYRSPECGTMACIYGDGHPSFGSGDMPSKWYGKLGYNTPFGDSFSNVHDDILTLMKIDNPFKNIYTHTMNVLTMPVAVGASFSDVYMQGLSSMPHQMRPYW